MSRIYNSCLFLTANFTGVFKSENVGWKKSFADNAAEFHDLQLEWENGISTIVPTWLTGIYVRNGPGQV